LYIYIAYTIRTLLQLSAGKQRIRLHCVLTPNYEPIDRSGVASREQANGF